MSKAAMNAFMVGLVCLPVIGISMAFITGDAPWLVLCFALCALL